MLYFRRGLAAKPSFPGERTERATQGWKTGKFAAVPGQRQFILLPG